MGSISVTRQSISHAAALMDEATLILRRAEPVMRRVLCGACPDEYSAIFSEAVNFLMMHDRHLEARTAIEPGAPATLTETET